MGYILVQPEVLLAKGINYFETIPDGRAIAEMRMLKVLGSITSVDIISSSVELKKLIADQIAAGITPPVPEDERLTDDIPSSGDIENDDMVPEETDTSNESTEKMEVMTDGNEYSRE